MLTLYAGYRARARQEARDYYFINTFAQALLTAVIFAACLVGAAALFAWVIGWGSFVSLAIIGATAGLLSVLGYYGYGRYLQRHPVKLGSRHQRVLAAMAGSELATEADIAKTSHQRASLVRETIEAVGKTTTGEWVSTRRGDIYANEPARYRLEATDATSWTWAQLAAAAAVPLRILINWPARHLGLRFVGFRLRWGRLTYTEGGSFRFEQGRRVTVFVHDWQVNEFTGPAALGLTVWVSPAAARRLAEALQLRPVWYRPAKRPAAAPVHPATLDSPPDHDPAEQG